MYLSFWDVFISLNLPCGGITWTNRYLSCQAVCACAKGKILELWSRGLRKDKPREGIKCYLAKGMRIGFRINFLANDQRWVLVIHPLVVLRFQVSGDYSWNVEIYYIKYHYTDYNYQEVLS